MGVQQVAQVARQGGGLRTDAAARRVERIARKREAGGGHVDADLVGAPRLDLHLQEAVRLPALQHPRAAERV